MADQTYLIRLAYAVDYEIVVDAVARVTSATPEEAEAAARRMIASARFEVVSIDAEKD